MPFIPKSDHNDVVKSPGTRMQNFRDYKPKTDKKDKRANNLRNQHDATENYKSNAVKDKKKSGGQSKKPQKHPDGKKVKEEFKQLIEKMDEQKKKKVKKYRGKSKKKLNKDATKSKDKNAKPEKGGNVWLKFSKFGSVVKSTPFVPFKMPMIKPLSGPGLLLLEDQFRLEQLFEAHPNIGLIIDLTGSGGGYDIKFDKHIFEYHHIKCSARFDDDMKKVDDFIKKCTDFIAKNPDKLIGVHDFTGTRTASLCIVQYLRQELGHNLTEAIDMFEEARGEKMFELYVNSLKSN